MSSLKQKTISGLSWSFIDKFASQFIGFVVGIVLARLLTPAEFGLIGMLTIFIALSNVFIQSGFNQALIRKIDCNESDYATVFYFNLTVSLIFYIVLYLISDLISNFYNQEQLSDLIKVLGLTLIINALTIIQQTTLTKRVDFKLLTKVSLISAIGSGIVGVSLAFAGFGVWSLVYIQLTKGAITSVLLWSWNKWYPKEKFSFETFKVLFKFSGNLMVLGIIDTIYRNVYYLIIGKYYPAANLGHYTRAENFKKLPAETLSSIIDRVSFPVLSSIQSDKNKYKEVFRKLLKTSSLISFVLLMLLSAVSRELTVVLMGPEWLLSGEYLEILCFSALFFPLNKMFSSVLKIEGRSDLILKLGIIRKFMAIPVILTAIFIGIKAMLFVLVVQQIGAAILMSSYGAKYAGLSLRIVFSDLIPFFLVGIIMFLLLTAIGYVLTFAPIYMLIIKIIVGIFTIVGLFELTKNKDFLYLKAEFISKIKSIGNKT